MPTTTIQDDKEKLLKILREKAFFKEKIILSSGKESDYYLDARRVTLMAEGAYLSAKIILELVNNEKFDAIGGPTLGADPIVGALGVLSYQAQKPVNTFIVRKAPKAHGKQQQIEGPLLKEGATVILIDDVATTGKAFLESIDVLKKAKINVKKCVCIIDRDEGAKDALGKVGCELVSIFKGKDFF
ncbi:MAG: orotate phosphoribosyltransferase [Omnitrophica WOR_2 bacterium GWA2_47_8]|nr:MAG: orotate phosphoribosyltransferase [Omnitrophica WOR_2 bacterium GWA2_47_8]